MTDPHLSSILLANEPRAYRQALAAAMGTCRAGAEVIAVEPAELDAAVERHRPALVVCNAVTPVVEARVPVWVLLYPDGARLVVTSVHGALRYASDMSLEALGGLADEALAWDATAGVPRPDPAGGDLPTEAPAPA